MAVRASLERVKGQGKPSVTKSTVAQMHLCETPLIRLTAQVMAQLRADQGISRRFGLDAGLDRAKPPTMSLKLLTWLTVLLGLLLLVGGVLIVFARRRGVRFRLSEEEKEIERGLAKVAQRSGTKWGMAGNTEAELRDQHASSSSSGGDSGDDDA